MTVQARLYFVVAVLVVTICHAVGCYRDKRGKDKENDLDLMLSVGSSPSLLAVHGVSFSLEHLQTVLDSRADRSVFTRWITVQVAKEAEIDNVTPILALLREKGISEIRMIFSPLTFEELVPPQPPLDKIYNADQQAVSP